MVFVCTCTRSFLTNLCREPFSGEGSRLLSYFRHYFSLPRIHKLIYLLNPYFIGLLECWIAALRLATQSRPSFLCMEDPYRLMRSTFAENI